MSLSCVRTSSNSHLSPQPCKLLWERSQYQGCRIRVPDQPQSLPAVRQGDEYYSYLRFTTSAQKALSTAIKIAYRGEKGIITRNTRGYTMWILERDAEPVRVRSYEQQSELGTCQLIAGRKEVQPRQLTISGSTNKFPGIEYQGRYYQLLQAAKTAATALDIASELVIQNRPVVLAPTKVGFAVGVWRPDATVPAEAA